MRKDRADKILAGLDADEILICDPESIRYLTGKLFHPGERFLGLLLGKNKEPVLFLNALFEAGDTGVRVHKFTDTDDVAEMLKKEINPDHVLAVDKIMQARFLLPLMERGAAKGFVNGSLAVDKTRAVKDAEEIALMRKSSEINDHAMAEFTKLIHEGVTEKEVAAQTLAIYQSFGAEAFSFTPIVAFGDNAADPHHMPDDTVLQDGDIVLFDVGCKYHGYCSDMTRTFFWKKAPDAEAERVYNLVRTANEEAEKICRPGARLCDIDKKARDIITEGGYGEDFTHRLGHFIGTEDHEYGDVSSGFDWECVPGNIFSIEPGIYHRGIAGVRIEDLVLITEDGCEVLNHYPKDIQILG